MASPAPIEQVSSDTDQQITLIDSDVHNYPNGIEDLTPHMSRRWQAYIEQSGMKLPGASFYPKVFREAARRDAFPPSGKRPGGDPDFAREQLLDAWGIDLAILNPLIGLTSVFNLDLGNAIMSAANDWTQQDWLESDPRWYASIVVNPLDPIASAAEIRRLAGNPRFVQVLLLVRSPAPYGRRQFHPIFEAARGADLPVGIHFGGSGNPITAVGWPSYYLEDHTGMAQAFESQLISIVCEGIFELFPETRVALIEGGFAWLPALMWRLDKNFRGLRSEVPFLKRLPSEYILENVRFTTQPMEEPPNPEFLTQILNMIGRDDMLFFATDYPHWDFDAPDRAIPSGLSEDLRRRIYATNAWEFYDFPHV